MALAPLLVDGVFKLYDAIMADKPDDVTEAEWRARLTDPAMTKTADDYLNAARKELAERTPVPVQPVDPVPTPAP